MTDVTNHRGGNTLHHVCAELLAPQDREEAGDVVFPDRSGQLLPVGYLAGTIRHMALLGIGA